jgi:ribosomal protein L40E
MKLSSFLPEIKSRDTQLIQSNRLLNTMYENGFTNFVKSKYSGNSQSAVKEYGIEQLYFDWLRTAYAYRRMFIQDLYLLAFDSAEIRTPLLHIRNEVFRKGFDEWKPKFSVKCNKCGEESKERPKECKKCGSTDLREPDPEQYKEFDKLRKNCNIFGQSLEDIFQILSDDVGIVDDAWIFLNKQYIPSSKKMYSKVVEIRRIHPALIEFDLDKAGLPKNSHWFCPFHRDKIEAKQDNCPECGTLMQPAMYIWNHRGQRIYLFEDEIIHFSKFSGSETYGYSVILTVMQKVLTISGMDKFLYRYFFERKTPTQMILTSTDDPQSLEIERSRIESRMMEDPTYTPWIAVSSRTQRGRTDVVKLWHTLQEMDYLNVRNEIRDRIAAIYGVPQLYMNVMEGVGGLSGQTQQMKVFSNVIEADQRRYNERIFPILLENFGITDWEIKLRPPEDKVESVILQLAQQKVAIAGQMMQLGFDIKLKPGSEDIETLDFEFSGESINPMKQQQQMMAMQQQQGSLGQGQEQGQEGLSQLGGEIQGDNMPKDIPRELNPQSPTEEDVFREN